MRRDKPVGKFVHVKFRYQEPLSNIPDMYTKETDFEPAELLQADDSHALVRFIRFPIDMLVDLRDIETMKPNDETWWNHDIPDPPPPEPGWGKDGRRL
jgi:hypothetical protein